MNPTTAYLPKENENSNLKSCMHPYVYGNIVCDNQNREAT